MFGCVFSKAVVAFTHLALELLVLKLLTVMLVVCFTPCVHSSTLPQAGLSFSLGRTRSLPRVSPGIVWTLGLYRAAVSVL